MKFNGTGKNDHLNGLASDDVLNGGKGNDVLDGHGGNDTLTGGAGKDLFIISAGGGTDTITDFDPKAGDLVLFDFDSFPDAMFVGPLADGMAWTSDTGGNCSVNSDDFNGDGQMDTQIYVNDSSVILLGCAPEDLTGQMFLGG